MDLLKSQVPMPQIPLPMMRSISPGLQKNGSGIKTPAGCMLTTSSASIKMKLLLPERSLNSENSLQTNSSTDFNVLSVSTRIKNICTAI